MVIRKLIFIAGLIAISVNTLAEEVRPQIGLVLSGGGARGAAHVGVLKVLERERIPIDYIAGTSMGSIVGGLYASGLTASEIEATINMIDWDDALNDAPSRADKQIIRKQTEDIFSMGARLGFREGQLLLPQGLIQGQKILPILQALTHHVAHVHNFDDLPIPFRAVATDITNGEMVVLKDGDLARTMRASMAVPSVFAPIEMGEHLLVDGGITNNLPIDIAKEMGAEIIIAVDISTPYRKKDEIQNILHITDQLTRLLTGSNSTERKKLLTEDDVFITPPLGDISSGDFDRSSEAIPIGETETLNHLDELRELALSENDFFAHVAGRNRVSVAANDIKSITLNNNSNLDDRILERMLTVKAGDQFDMRQLSEDLYNIHTLGNFQSVAYRMDHTAEGIDLYLDAATRAWGPNYLYLGLDISSDIEGDSVFNIQTGYSREEISDKGGIWTSYVTFGSEPNVNTHYYQPLTYELGPYVTASATIGRINQAIFDDDHKVAEYRLNQNEISAGIGWEFSHRSAIAIGIDRIAGSANILIGDEGLPEPDYHDGGIYLNYRYDSLDERYFPTTGRFLELWAHASLDSFGADEEYQQYRMQTGRVFAFGDSRVAVSLTAGTTSGGTSTIGGVFEVGGGPLLLGLENGQLLGQHMAVAQLFVYKEYNPNPIISGYIGGLLEYGGAWQDRDDISADTSVGSASVFVALDTPVGPLQFGVGATDGGKFSYYTRIGHLF